jgi:hypothetical protein
MDKSLVSLTFTFIEQKSLQCDVIIDRIEKYINTIQLRDLKTSIDHYKIALITLKTKSNIDANIKEAFVQSRNLAMTVFNTISDITDKITCTELIISTSGFIYYEDSIFLCVNIKTALDNLLRTQSVITLCESVCNDGWSFWKSYKKQTVVLLRNLVIDCDKFIRIDVDNKFHLHFLFWNYHTNLKVSSMVTINNNIIVGTHNGEIIKYDLEFKIMNKYDYGCKYKITNLAMLFDGNIFFQIHCYIGVLDSKTFKLITYVRHKYIDNYDVKVINGTKKILIGYEQTYYPTLYEYRDQKINKLEINNFTNWDFRLQDAYQSTDSTIYTVHRPSRSIGRNSNIYYEYLCSSQIKDGTIETKIIQSRNDPKYGTNTRILAVHENTLLLNQGDIYVLTINDQKQDIQRLHEWPKSLLPSNVLLLDEYKSISILTSSNNGHRRETIHGIRGRVERVLILDNGLICVSDDNGDIVIFGK